VFIKKGEYQLAEQELESYPKAVRSGQVREDAGSIKNIERKLSDAKAKTTRLLED